MHYLHLIKNLHAKLKVLHLKKWKLLGHYLLKNGINKTAHLLMLIRRIAVHKKVAVTAARAGRAT